MNIILIFLPIIITILGCLAYLICAVKMHDKRYVAIILIAVVMIVGVIISKSTLMNGLLN